MKNLIFFTLTLFLLPVTAWAQVNITEAEPDSSQPRLNFLPPMLSTSTPASFTNTPSFIQQRKSSNTFFELLPVRGLLGIGSSVLLMEFDPDVPHRTSRGVPLDLNPKTVSEYEYQLRRLQYTKDN